VPQAGVGKVGVDPRRSVGAFRGRVELRDVLDELVIDAFPLRLHTGLVLVVGGPGDLE
jgi:hypothetical protein